MSRSRSTTRFTVVGIFTIVVAISIGLSLNFALFPVNARVDENAFSGPTEDIQFAPTATNGKLYFSSGRAPGSPTNLKVHSMNADGTGVTCLMCGSGDTRIGRLPAVSPDGTMIAYVDTASPASIHLMNIDGSNDRVLTTGSSPAWSPQSDRILFTRSIATPTTHNELFIVSTNGSGEAPLNDSPTHNNVLPVWSVTSATYPEGRIAFRSSRDGNSEIYVIAPTAGQNFQDAPQINITNNSATDSDPAWSPDGTKLAFQSDRFQIGAVAEIYTMELNPNPGTVTRLTNDGPSPGGFQDSTPVWSPDGTKIAFVSFRSNYEIVVINSTTGAPIEPPVGGNITNDPAIDFDVDWAAGPARTIRAVDVSGTAGQQVVVSFELASLGDEAGISFSVNFEQTKLSNPVVTLGSGAPPSANVTTNLTQTSSGRIGILVDSLTPFVAGNRQMLTIRFNVAASATAGPSAISFGTAPTGQIVTSLAGATLPTTYQPGNVNIATASVSNGKIAFERFTDSAGVTQIYTIADTAGATAAVCGGASETREGRRPAYSADGTKLAFMRAGTIWTSNADCSNQFSTGSAGDAPTWSPDGTKIAFVRGGSFSDIWTMNADGTNQVKLTDIATETKPAGSFSNAQPSWGSNNKIVFRGLFRKTVNGNLASVGDIWTMDAAGSTFVRLTDDPVNAYAPDWSPDSSKVAFASNRATNRGEIYTMNADGSNQTRITNNASISNSNPAWSPDGTKIVHDDDFSNITRRNSDGSNAAVLSLGNFPDWQTALPSADIRITNIANTPNPGTIDEMLYFRINLVNNGPSTATGISVTTDPQHPFPAWVFFQPANSSPGCLMNANRTITCNLANNLAGSGLGVDGFVDVAMTASQLGAIDFRAHVSAVQSDPNLANNDASAITNVVGAADLSLDVTGPTSSSVNTDIVYSMRVTNNGPATAVGVQAEFNMPSSPILVEFVSADPPAYNCAPAPVSGGTKVTCNIGTMNPGVTLTPRITVKARGLGNILVGGSVSASGSRDLQPSNNTDSHTTNIQTAPSADLGISVQYSPNVLSNTVRVGENYSVYFTVQNAGPLTATNAIIIFTTASGVEGVPGLTDPRCNSTVNGAGETLFVCSIGNINSGSSVNQVGITLRPLATGARHDIATVTANEPDESTGNNAVTTNVTVLGGIVDLEMIADFPPQIFLGDNATVTVRVKNNGPSSASNVRIRIQRFSGTQLVSISGSGCTEDAGIISCPLGNIAAGQSSSVLTSTFRPNSTGDMRLELLTDSSTPEQFPDPHPNGGIINVPVKPRVELIGLEVTQGVQDLANSIPLIRGRKTYVRAYLKTQGGSGDVTPELVGYRNTASGLVSLGTLPISNVGKTNIFVSTDPDRDSLEGNPYFYLPEDWTNAESYMFELRLKGSSSPLVCSEPDESSNCKAIVNLRTGPEMPVQIVMLGYRWNGIDYIPSKQQRNLVIDQINATFPIRSLSWTESYIPLTPDVCPGNSSFPVILNVVEARRILDCPSGNCPKRYLGLLDATGPCGSGGLGGGSTRSGVGGVQGLASSVEFNLPHELGHVIGLAHTAYSGPTNGTAGGPEPHTPSNGTISVTKGDFDTDTIFGVDVWNFNQYDTDTPKNTQRVFGPDTPTFMTYAVPRKWISEHHYRRILSFLDGNGGIAGVRPLEEDGQRVQTDEIVMVSGLAPLQPGGTALLQPVFRINSPRTISLPSTGTHEIWLENAQGQMLATYNFSPLNGSDGTAATTAAFTLALPWINGTSRISLRKGGQVVASQQASANAPQVNIVSPNGGETLNGASTQVQWTATDADPGSTLRYILQFSPDGGTTWQTLVTDCATTNFNLDLRNLTGTTSGLLRVFASDGFNTSSDVSNSTFTVTPHAPDVSISGVENNRLFVADQVIVLGGEAQDVEDGLLPDSALTWSSDRNGLLGTGRSLSVVADTLQEGTHTITLTGKDSNNQTSTATVSLIIARVPPILPPALSVGMSQMFFSATLGTQPTGPQNLSVANNGGGNLTWSASSDSQWIVLDSTSGSAPATTSVTVNPSGLQVGTYSGKITFTAAGAANSPQIVNVYLAVVQAPLVTVTGRVVTPTGLGLRNTRVVITNALGVSRSATTSSFGIFSFANVPGGETYTIGVVSKRYRFAPRIVPLTGDVTLPDFVGLE